MANTSFHSCSSVLPGEHSPWVAYHHIGSGELFSDYLWDTVILAISLIGAIFLDRPFCRYLCPMGGFLALPSFQGFSRIRHPGGTAAH